ncbi:hypothetical protein L228DRAFT_148119 [Xylona heveae TC161]|uniref:DUF7593 domain-containing protein n=1 Tax=Xylona heveae (strain CBS 132557 / TC161) TaxID=1328760 RepID=A0A165GHS8_XYLHT|nr:hypothetical protein L228DRAFT_148119 [Xylona heveae TC161]KZF22200.1 hypothetical protein L228DRAFT_148119 [Xylona heveae TC161]
MNREQPENLTEERWVVNFQVAPVLGIKDLELSQCNSIAPFPRSVPSIFADTRIVTAWEKRSLTDRQRTCIWRVARRMLAESDEPTPLNSSIQGLAKLDAATAAKFFDMKHVFWIKLSDFIDIVPRYPHLRDVPVTTLPVCLEYLDGPNGPIFPERKVTRQRPDNTFQSQLNDAQPQRNFNNSMEAVMHQMPQHAPALPNGFIH